VDHDKNGGQGGEDDGAGAAYSRVDDGLLTRLAFGNVFVDLIDQYHQVAHNHAGQSNHAQGGDKAEGELGDEKREADAYHAEWRTEQHHEHTREALQLHH